MRVNFHKNGRFESATGASIFAGSDGADILQVKIGWANDSTVVAKFLLPYSQGSKYYGQYDAQSLLLALTPDLADGGFMWVTPDGIPGGYLANSGKAYLSVQLTTSDQKIVIKSTEMVEFVIGESGQYVANPVLPEMTDQILAAIARLDANKLDRFNIDAMPTGLTFNQDGIKAPNAWYYNATYQVVDKTIYTTDPNESYMGDKTFVNKTGVLLVNSIWSNTDNDPVDGDTVDQTETFIADGRIWQRVLKFVRNNGEWTIDDIPDFNEVGIETALDLITQAVKMHNDDLDAHNGRLTDLENEVEGLKNLSHLVGSFDNFATPQAPGNTVVPTNKAAFTKGITINDFVDVRADETRPFTASDGTAHYPTTRYVAEAIDPDTGQITWVYDITYSTDITGKMDKQPGATPGNFVAFDTFGNATDSGVNSQTITNQINEAVDDERQRAELALEQHDTSPVAHQDIRQEIDSLQTTASKAVISPDQSVKNAIYIDFATFNAQRTAGTLLPNAIYIVTSDPADGQIISPTG